LYFHHSWQDWEALATQAFPMIRNHVFYYRAEKMDEASAFGAAVLNDALLESIVALIPDEWLLIDAPFSSTEQHRAAYLKFLSLRLAYSKHFNQKALHGR
jgi:hypothetical protein